MGAPRVSDLPQPVDALWIEAHRERGESALGRALARLKARRSARWSLRFLFTVALLALFAPLLPVPSPRAFKLQTEPKPPVWPWVEPYNMEYRAEYTDLNPVDRGLVDLRSAIFGKRQIGPWLGSDNKGRDLLSRILWGSRKSLGVALAAGLCGLVIGLAFGAFAGLRAGRLGSAMMRLVDALQSLPLIFVVIFVLALIDAPRADLSQPRVDREKVFFIVLGATSWLTLARVVRGQVLSLRQAEFIQAARALGASELHLLRVHVLPNVLAIAVVYLTLSIPSLILAEAFLSFLGLGVAPPEVSWGLLAADGLEALSPLAERWWLVVWPAVAMAATLVALNFLGDGLRDALEVRGDRA